MAFSTSPGTACSRPRPPHLAALPAVVLLGTAALSACSDPGASASGEHPAKPQTTAARNGVVYNTSPDQQRIRAEKDAALAAKVPELIGKDGKLTMATTAGSIPLSFHATDDKTPIGSELDIAQLVADKLGLELDVQVTSWENWPLKTQSGDFEAVFSNVGVNKDRVKLFDFASYRAAYMGFEAKKSATYDIKGADDISGLKVSVGSGTNQEKILLAWNKELEGKGKAPAVLQYYSVRRGHHPGAVLGPHRPEHRPLPVHRVPGKHPRRPEGRGQGQRRLAVRDPGGSHHAARATGWPRSITEALNSAIKDGSYGKVLERWGLSEEALPESKTITEENFAAAQAGATPTAAAELEKHMKFQVLDIIPHLKNPLTGEIVSTADRLNQVVETARRAEDLGYDSFSVGERHAGEFISSSPTTVLAAIAAVTDRIRLQSGVTVLSVLDPVRVAEDYATIDQLSRGRLELVIGKGNEVLQYPLFGLDLADQWDLLAEKYGLLRRLWREENVTWSGRFRAPADRADHHHAPPVRRSAADLARLCYNPDVGGAGRQVGRPAVHRQRHPAAGKLPGADRALPRRVRTPRPRPAAAVRRFGQRRRRRVHRRHHPGGHPPVRARLRGADGQPQRAGQQLARSGTSSTPSPKGPRWWAARSR